jgi:hypothetical protein
MMKNVLNHCLTPFYKIVWIKVLYEFQYNVSEYIVYMAISNV